MMSSSSGDDRAGPRTNGKFMDPTLQGHIGRKLRDFYDQITDEPVPDRFKRLLDRLEQAEADEAAASPDAPSPVPPE